MILYNCIECYGSDRTISFVHLSFHSEANCRHHVNGIIKVPAITKVPNMPPFISGVINLRGKVTTIINLKDRLHMNDVEFGENSKIITLDLEEDEIGMIVDDVHEVLRISNDDITDPPKTITGLDRKFVSHIAQLKEYMVLILDILEIMSEEKIIEAIKSIEKGDEE